MDEGEPYLLKFGGLDRGAINQIESDLNNSKNELKNNNCLFTKSSSKSGCKCFVLTRLESSGIVATFLFGFKVAEAFETLIIYFIFFCGRK
jgi:hypothetical protein